MAGNDAEESGLPGQGAFSMSIARGSLALDKNASDYKGAGGEKLRQQDRENYKTATGMYPEDDKDLVAQKKKDDKAWSRYQGGK